MPLPPTRSVARGLVNLGNSCYMNAVLQALAHAPELCLAMDCESHRATCPIAAENALKRRKNSPSSSPDNDEAAVAAVVQDARKNAGTRKSRRTGRKSPPGAAAENNNPSSSTGDTDLEFCALCEVENHIRHVHEASKRDKPVAPSAFVHGFIDNVAPQFQLGVQEDSHEFLRLLIDAMQKSCQKARLQDNPQDDSPNQASNDEDDHDTEYPFSLFRGTVESNVVCEFCQHSSSTLDPIEDVGLEVTVSQPNTPPALERPSRNISSRNPSRNPSPVPNMTLSDVQSAFKRFARAEALDSGYKCEKCGKVGRATKQSRLASIPPILTLHLKRFRYGDRVAPAAPAPTRRSCRSEVSQLLGSNDYSTGKSGSAKIEGHIKFDMFFDLKPYLTDELREKPGKHFCRLFAVIVHAGKNSHSGHYVAYVRNIGKNEWWKMDDSRVTAVTPEEVMQAEAYMLFYRVVQHPVAMRLEEKHKKMKLFQESVVKMAMPVTPNTRRKRELEYADSADDWNRKTNVPPHLAGLLQKISEMIADGIQISAQYYKTISDEAALHNATIGKVPPLVGKFASSSIS